MVVIVQASPLARRTVQTRAGGPRKPVDAVQRTCLSDRGAAGAFWRRDVVIRRSRGASPASSSFLALRQNPLRHDRYPALV
jgi:hypothetical protein